MSGLQLRVISSKQLLWSGWWLCLLRMLTFTECPCYCCIKNSLIPYIFNSKEPEAKFCQPVINSGLFLLRQIIHVHGCGDGLSCPKASMSTAPNTENTSRILFLIVKTVLKETFSLVHPRTFCYDKCLLYKWQ